MPPRRTAVIPLRMADGKLAAAWSGRPDEFRARLAEVLAARPREPEPDEPDPDPWGRNPAADA